MATGADEAVSIILSCETCGASYRLGEVLIRGVRGVRVRCRKCGESINFENPEMPPGSSLGKGTRGIPQRIPRITQ